MSERSLVLIKPDAVARGLIGEILSRYERRGLVVRELSMRTITGDFADQHYAEHVGKDWYPGLRAFITSGPLVAAVLEGPGAVSAIRTMNGTTNGNTAAPGSVRGDLALTGRENVVHSSDSTESARREIDLWFPAS